MEMDFKKAVEMLRVIISSASDMSKDDVEKKSVKFEFDYTNDIFAKILDLTNEFLEIVPPSNASNEIARDYIQKAFYWAVKGLTR